MRSRSPSERRKSPYRPAREEMIGRDCDDDHGRQRSRSGVHDAVKEKVRHIVMQGAWMLYAPRTRYIETSNGYRIV